MAAEHTRIRLLQAAEKLIAEYGVTGVSLRQIGKAAGERNTAAVQYHFGDRDGLIAAIFERRMAHIDAKRVALLDKVEAGGRTADLHAVIEAAVLPLADFLLEDSEEAWAYLIFMAQVQRHTRTRIIDAVWEANAVGLQRVLHHVQEALSALPEPIAQQRIALMVCYIIQAWAEHALQLQEADPAVPHPDTVLFARNLVDTVVGLVGAPVSADTWARLEAGAAATS